MDYDLDLCYVTSRLIAFAAPSFRSGPPSLTARVSRHPLLHGPETKYLFDLCSPSFRSGPPTASVVNNVLPSGPAARQSRRPLSSAPAFGSPGRFKCAEPGPGLCSCRRLKREWGGVGSGPAPILRLAALFLRGRLALQKPARAKSTYPLAVHRPGLEAGDRRRPGQCEDTDTRSN